MTAEQPTHGPAPRRVAADTDAPIAPAPLETPAPVAGPSGIAPLDAPAPTAGPAVAIATLDAPPTLVIGVPDNPRTGEPRIPKTVIAAAVSSYLSVAALAGGLLKVYWDAVPKDNFANASWLMGQFVTEPGSLGRVLLAVAVTVIALVIAVPVAITGYYGWAGYRWSRISGLIGGLLSFGALTLNVYAWATVPLALLGAGLLWTPAAARYFVAWRARRHPAENFAPPTTDVFYGPLPRYR